MLECCSGHRVDRDGDQRAHQHRSQRVLDWRPACCFRGIGAVILIPSHSSSAFFPEHPAEAITSAQPVDHPTGHPECDLRNDRLWNFAGLWISDWTGRAAAASRRSGDGVASRRMALYSTVQMSAKTLSLGGQRGQNTI